MAIKKGPILLIDDDQDEWELMKDVFTETKIKNTLLCFADGKQAINYLRTTTEQPFLIFSDINMPGMNGLEFRRVISSDEQLRKKSIPFIFFTTSANAKAVEEAYELSVQGFFEKPHSMGEIKALIKEIYGYWQHCRHPNN